VYCSAGLLSQAPGGVITTSSATPASRAGITVITAVDG